MKMLGIISMLLIGGTVLLADDIKPPTPAQVAASVGKTDDNPYAAGQFGLSYFASYRVKDFDGILDRFGSGAEVSYSISENVTVALEGMSENPQHSFIDDAGANFKFYLPIGATGFAPYGLLGYSHGFETKDNRMNAGAGIELRGKSKGLFGVAGLAVFADGRWTHDFENIGHALFRAGGSIRF